MPKKDKKTEKIRKQFQTSEVKVFQQFRKQKIFNQISFVMAALVMAFWINSFVLNWQYWEQLKTNILETNIKKENKSDIYVEKEKNIAKIKVAKRMDNVKSISFGLVYNPEAIDIQDIVSDIKEIELLKLENEKGITTLILNFNEPKSIKSWESILDLYISKKIEKTTQNINIINSNFTDSTGAKYELTTSWITF